jgi:hypothetical protein
MLHLDAVRRRLDARLSAWTEVRQTPAPEHVSHDGAVSGSEQNTIDFVTVVDFEAGFFYGENGSVGSGNCMNVASDYSCSWCQISHFNWTPSLEWKLYAYFSSRNSLDNKNLRERVGVSLELAMWGAFMFFCTFSVDRMAFFFLATKRLYCVVCCWFHARWHEW